MVSMAEVHDERKASRQELTNKYAARLKKAGVTLYQELAAALARRKIDAVPLNDLQRQLLRNFEVEVRCSGLWSSTLLAENNRAPELVELN